VSEAGLWQWHAPTFSQFCARKYDQIDWVSHETGFLGVRALLEVNPIAPVPKGQHYRFKSVVEGIRDFMHKTFVQAGYSNTSNAGYTIRSLFDLHLERVLGDKPKALYAAAHKAHVQRMKQLKDTVDKEFWPDPKAAEIAAKYRIEHAGDSDDHVTDNVGSALVRVMGERQKVCALLREERHVDG
jgi:hypothetical protein